MTDLRDRCPYARPFAADFDDCEAFQPVRFIPLSSDYRPLAPVRTCRHLVSRRAPGEWGRWYGACALGDAAARRAWVAAVEPSRLGAIARLRGEMADINAPFIDQLWLLKGEQLEARSAQRDPSLYEQRMHDVGEQFVAQTGDFLRARRETLAEIDITVDAILYLLRVSVDHLITRTTGDVRWEIPEEALARFSPQVRLFFRPPAAQANLPLSVPLE